MNVRPKAYLHDTGTTVVVLVERPENNCWSVANGYETLDQDDFQTIASCPRVSPVTSKRAMTILGYFGQLEDATKLFFPDLMGVSEYFEGGIEFGRVVFQEETHDSGAMVLLDSSLDRILSISKNLQERGAPSENLTKLIIWLMKFREKSRTSIPVNDRVTQITLEVWL